MGSGEWSVGKKEGIFLDSQGLIGLVYKEKVTKTKKVSALGIPERSPTPVLTEP